MNKTQYYIIPKMIQDPSPDAVGPAIGPFSEYIQIVQTYLGCGPDSKDLYIAEYVTRDVRLGRENSGWRFDAGALTNRNLLPINFNSDRIWDTVVILDQSEINKTIRKQHAVALGQAFIACGAVAK
jgi:hypothetical protein